MRMWACQLLLDAPLEAIVHGLFLQPALGAAAKNEDFLPARSRAELDLKPFVHFTPVAVQQLLLELAQHALGRAQDIAPPALLQELHVVGQNHPPIHHPDPLGLAVLALHRLDDLFNRGNIAAIAGKHLVAKRQTTVADYHRDVDLLAVRAVIAGVASLRLRVGCGGAFKIGAGHVIQQQVVVQVE